MWKVSFNDGSGSVRESEDEARNFIRWAPQGSEPKIAPANPYVDWRDMAMLKLIRQSWTVPIWHSQPWWVGLPGHFAHISEEDPQQIAFFASEDHAKAWRITRMKPGKYLTRFFGEVLSKKSIAAMAEWWRSGTKPVNGKGPALKFASTPDEIVRVYANGPDSCMYGDDCVRVYGAGDLAIAYFEDLDNSGVEEVAARCLCRPEKKVFGRCYGEDEDANFLISLLRKNGWQSIYEQPTAFDGAKILAERDEHGWVMPYMDHGGVSWSDDQSHFVMSRAYDFECDSTCGYIEIDEFQCEECGTSMREGDSYTAYSHWDDHPVGEMRVCCSCYEGGTGCSFTNEVYLNSGVAQVVIMGRGGIRSLADAARGWALANAFHCEYNDNWYRLREESDKYPGFPAHLDDDEAAHPPHNVGDGPAPGTCNELFPA